MQQPPIGTNVQYVAKTTRGPYAGLVVAHNDDGTITVQVFTPGGNSFPAFRLTPEPTTRVKHYWRHVPVLAESLAPLPEREGILSVVKDGGGDGE